MAGTTSVSKGVFSFKKPKSKQRVNASTVDYWTEEEEVNGLTYKNYVKCRDRVAGVMNELQENVHSKVFEDLVEFIKEASVNRTRKDIPTACLVTGVNMPDHDAMYGSIVRLLVDGITPCIAQLRSRDCATVRSTIFKMVSQLMGQYDMVDIDLLDEIVTGPAVKRAQCNMAVLTSWYKERTSSSLQNNSPAKSPESSQRYQKSPRKNMASPQKSLNSPRKAWSSPRKAVSSSPYKGVRSSPQKNVGSSSSVFESPKKKKKLGDESSHTEQDQQQAPLVVILEDVESFPTHVLHDLILICSEYHPALPIVFVFGVATTPAAVHRSLSQDASSCIAMETFQAQPSTYYLNHVIDKVLLSDIVPFHVGGRTFKLLLDIFLYHDLSVKNFMKGIQLCMMEHFLGNSSSFLCCEPSARGRLIKNMTSKQLDIIRKLPSFRSYVESRPTKEQADLLISERVSKDTVLRLTEELDVWYVRFSCLVKVVHALTSTLSHSPLGRQIREVLSVCLLRPLVDTKEYQEAHKTLSLMAREELIPLLKNVDGILKDYCKGDEQLIKFSDEIQRFLEQLNNLDQMETVEGVQEPEDKTLSIQASDRFHLKEKLQELAKKKAKKPNAYESLRLSLLELLDSTFQQHLKPPNKQPLHEIFFFDSSSVIKRQLQGMSRVALMTALSNPHHYLQCECCNLDDPTSIVTTLPDVVVAYKLHLECGRLINLYDWLQAYISVVDPEADETDMKSMDQKLQARFVQAVSELQFLGFIKPTGRKTDHVARLTWGSC